MPNFTLEKLPGEPIIVGIASPQWQSAADMPVFVEQLTALLEAADEPVFYIGDMSAWQVDLTEIITAANQVARSANAIARHPKIREFIVISTSGAVELGARGVNSAAFGQTHITVLPTVEAALDYARRTYREEAV